MLTLSLAQVVAFEQRERQNFLLRLAAHLATIDATRSRASLLVIAADGLKRREAYPEPVEDEVAALAEVLMDSGQARPPTPAWVDEILRDARPRKADRLRECLVMVRRIRAGQRQA